MKIICKNILAAAFALFCFVLGAIPVFAKDVQQQCFSVGTDVETDYDYIAVHEPASEDGRCRIGIEAYTWGPNNIVGSAVDWMGYVYEVDPTEAKMKVSRTVYKGEDGEPIGIIYAKAKSLFRFGDVVSLAVDAGIKKIFGESIIDSVEVKPGGEYMVRAYSGGLGVGMYPKDREFIETKMPHGMEREQAALQMNIFLAGFDSVTALFDPGKYGRDTLEKAAIAGLEAFARKKFGEPDLTSRASDEKEILQVFTDASGKVAPVLIFKGINEVSKAILNSIFTQPGAATRTVGFIEKSASLAIDLVNPLIFVKKISKVGSAMDRVNQLVWLAPPMTTAFVTTHANGAEMAKEVPAPLEPKLSESVSTTTDDQNMGGGVLNNEGISVKKENQDVIKQNTTSVSNSDAQPTSAPPKNEDVTGRMVVLDQFDRPVDNARIWFSDEQGIRYPEANFWGDHWETNQAGGLSCWLKDPASADFPRGTYNIHISKDYYDPIESKISFVFSSPEKSSISCAPNRFVLRRWSVVSAIVIGTSGHPVYIRTSTYLVDAQGKKYQYQKYDTDTGRLEFTPVPDGQYTLQISAGASCEMGNCSDIPPMEPRPIVVAGSDIFLGKITLNDK